MLTYPAGGATTILAIVGTIIGLAGTGLDAQAQIQFRDVGQKTLALGVAKLEVIAG